MAIKYSITGKLTNHMKQIVNARLKKLQKRDNTLFLPRGFLRFTVLRKKIDIYDSGVPKTKLQPISLLGLKHIDTCSEEVSRGNCLPLTKDNYLGGIRQIIIINKTGTSSAYTHEDLTSQKMGSISSSSTHITTFKSQNSKRSYSQSSPQSGKQTQTVIVTSSSMECDFSDIDEAQMALSLIIQRAFSVLSVIIKNKSGPQLKTFVFKCSKMFNNRDQNVKEKNFPQIFW